jgi:hypothetical protein
MVEFEKPKDGTAPSETDGSDRAQFSCPYCEDYAGKPDSVRGHIRAKTDPNHKGKSGFEDGTFAEPANGPSTETGSGTDDPELEDDIGDDDSDRDDAGIKTGVLIGLGVIAAALAKNTKLGEWLAEKTGNQNQFQERYGRP